MVPTPVHVLLIDISLVCSTHDIIKANLCWTRFSRSFSLVAGATYRAPRLQAESRVHLRALNSTKRTQLSAMHAGGG